MSSMFPLILSFFLSQAPIQVPVHLTEQPFIISQKEYDGYVIFKLNIPSGKWRITMECTEYWTVDPVVLTGPNLLDIQLNFDSRYSIPNCYIKYWMKIK